MNLILPEKAYQEALQEWMYDMPLQEINPLLRIPISKLRAAEASEEETRVTLERFRPLIEGWKKTNIALHVLLSNTSIDTPIPPRQSQPGPEDLLS